MGEVIKDYLKKALEKTVINNDDLSGNEKYKAIIDLEKDVSEISSALLSELDANYKYCNHCREYYKKEDIKITFYKEKREVCTYWPLAEFDEPTYEYKDCQITEQICPKGHKIKEDVKWWH